MSQRSFRSLPDFGFSPLQVDTLRHRLSMPQFLFVSGPAGGGKTKAALMVAWTFFQAYKRPFRVDGQDMTTEQIRQAAKEHTAGILFNDMAVTHDYMKAGYCMDCRMTAVALPFDGPANAQHALAYLLAFLPTLATRDDVTVLGIERDDDNPEVEHYKVDLHMT